MPPRVVSSSQALAFAAQEVIEEVRQPFAEILGSSRHSPIYPRTGLGRLPQYIEVQSSRPLNVVI